MRIIPILFSDPMVPPIIPGDKTMTRRLRALEEINRNPDKYSFYSAEGEMFDFVENGTQNHIVVKSPYGQTGDVLWVRESFCLTQPFDPETYHFGYKCGVQPYSYEPASEKYDFSRSDRWKPNIHMPFEACRFFLRVTNIRVERLQDISREDCKREGITLGIDNGAFSGWHDRFCDLWQSINGADSWNANPWVWAISFARITNGNEIAAIRKQWNERRAK